MGDYPSADVDVCSQEQGNEWQWLVALALTLDLVALLCACKGAFVGDRMVSVQRTVALKSKPRTAMA